MTVTVTVMVSTVSSGYTTRTSTLLNVPGSSVDGGLTNSKCVPAGSESAFATAVRASSAFFALTVTSWPLGSLVVFIGSAGFGVTLTCTGTSSVEPSG